MLDEILRGPLSFHTAAPPALLPFDGMTEAMRQAALALRFEPGRAELHAALGNALVRQTRYLEAIEAYRAAVSCDPDFACASLALSELLAIARHPDARTRLKAALEKCRFYEDPLPRGDRVPVTMLLRDAPYSTNTPLELIADREAVAIDKYYVEEESPRKLDSGVLFCGFNFSRDAQAAVAAAMRAVERNALPFVNHPERLVLAARERLSDTLAGISGVAVPDTQLVSREALSVTGPRLVRPADTHAGVGLALIASAQELEAHVRRFPSGLYHVSNFIDYASGDGHYRKYRVVFVDGVPYPYHLAISPRWMVHYRSAPMASHDWMRKEEAAFLDNPRSVFRAWDGVFADVSARIGLEYFGIDCTLTRDGSVLVFEADPSMLLHGEDPIGDFAYKNRAVGRIRNALTAMLRSRSQSTS